MLSRMSQELDSDQYDVDDLEMDIQRAKKSFVLTEETYQDFIATSKSPDDRTKAEDAQFKVTRDYTKVIKRAERKLLELVPPKTIAEGNSAQSSSTANGREYDIKLPTIQIEPFHGEYSKWPTFCDVFSSLVHNNKRISGAEKLQLLKNCLRDKAAAVVSYIPITNKNYEEAWKILKNRFENERLIVNKQLDLLFDMPKMTSQNGLEAILNTANGVVHSLKALNMPIEHWDAFLCRAVERKFDVTTTNAWEEKQHKKIPKFQTMADFVQERICIYEAEALQKASTNSPVVSTEPPIKKSSSQSPPLCPACQGQHKPSNCEAFKAASLPEKYGLIRMARRCLNCLEPYHSANICQAQGCKTCHRRHHTLLHEEDRRYGYGTTNATNPKKQEEQTSAANVATVATSQVLGDSLQQTLLGTANVYIKDNNGTPVKIRALLDPGSQMTIISTDCASRLQLPLQQTDMKISGIGKKVTNGVQGKAKVQIQNQKGDFSYNGSALIMDQLTSTQPLQRIVGEIEVAKGLSLADDSYKEPGPIEAILGVDIYMKACRRGLKHPKNGGPGAQNTAFGWVLMGSLPVDNNRSTKEDGSTCIANINVATQNEDAYDDDGCLSGSDSAEDLLSLVEHSGDFDKSVVYSLKQYVKARKSN